jgi:DNA-3-methyladenine glycosylase
MKLGKEFFSRNADAVARDLLGKVLIRKINEKEFRGKIVETEAYLSKNDETSKENNKKSERFHLMWEEEGTIFTYKVHNYDMLCIVTGERNKPECIFIRALEPLNFNLNCSGPGLLTRSLKIDNKFNGKNIENNNDLMIENSEVSSFEIIETKRIGLKEQKPLNLRFYIKDNKFVSRK